MGEERVNLEEQHAVSDRKAVVLTGHDIPTTNRQAFDAVCILDGVDVVDFSDGNHVSLHGGQQYYMLSQVSTPQWVRN